MAGMDIRLNGLSFSQTGTVVGSGPLGTPFDDRIVRVEIQGQRSGRTVTVPVKDGRLVSTINNPLRREPFEVSFVLNDGSRMTGTLDISPKAKGSSHQGYEPVDRLHMTFQAAPAPDPVELGAFMLNQAGRIMPGANVVPNNGGRFVALTVEPEDGHATNSYAITSGGKLMNPNGDQPLGDRPVRITLVGADGERFAGKVDISPKAVGVKRPGAWEEIRGLRVEHVPTHPNAPFTRATAAFAQTGGPHNDKPTIASSPAGVQFNLHQ